MHEELPKAESVKKSEDAAESLRKEVVARFPQVEIDIAALTPADLEVWRKISSGGISREDFQAWRMNLMGKTSGKRDHPRSKFLAALHNALGGDALRDASIFTLSKTK